jgi:hypothetical protein
MKLPRDEFIAQFAIPFHVHCLKLWSRRASEPPYSVARCCYEWVGITKGSVKLRVYEFTAVVRPVIDDLYRKTPKRQRPDANDLAAKVYDTLDGTGAQVTFGRPAGDPGCSRGRSATKSSVRRAASSWAGVRNGPTRSALKRNAPITLRIFRRYRHRTGCPRSGYG